jgi:hypothetical protein
VKLWRAQYQDPDEGAIVFWASSEREIRRNLAAELAVLRERAGDDENGAPVFVERVEVPTSRKELVGWLNMHLNRDNG